MFTGLIEEVGQVVSREIKGGKTRLSIRAQRIPEELELGDSIAVSGVCLTAVDVKRKQFSSDLAEETLKRTSLGHLAKGSCVNLELPMQAQDRLGGHVVQGHVDGVAKLISLNKIASREDWRLLIGIPSALARYVVLRGSIAVEGISLTVAGIAANQIEIAIIPHTYKATNLSTLHPGNPVNIEVDVLAKYAERSAAPNLVSKLTVGELVRRGF